MSICSAAIPLVDVDFNLLPVHFSIDPGATWNGIDCISGEPAETLLRRYLDVIELDVPTNTDIRPSGAPLISRRTESWTELAQSASTSRLETSSSSRSREFPTGQSQHHKSSTMDPRKLNNGLSTTDVILKSSSLSRHKLPSQMVRSFGSLGRSFRRLRKNFVNMAIRRKQQKSIDYKKDKNCASGIGTQASEANSTTSSSNCSTVGGKVGGANPPGGRILCARLLHRRQPYQEDMVRNYLSNAAERFKTECNKQQQTTTADSTLPPPVTMNGAEGYDNPGVSNTAAGGGGNEMKCVNVECSGIGVDASTSYLCAACYKIQKQEEIDAASSRQQNTTTTTVVQGSGSGSTVLATGPVKSSLVVYDNLHNGNTTQQQQPHNGHSSVAYRIE